MRVAATLHRANRTGLPEPTAESGTAISAWPYRIWRGDPSHSLRARPLHGKTLPLTQEALAHAIGVQRNAVSMVAHALREAGIIGYSRGEITIRDLEALRTTSCECYHAIRARHEHLIGTPH